MSNKIASNRNNISGHLKYVGVDPECGGVEGGSSSECALMERMKVGLSYECGFHIIWISCY